MCGTIIRKTQHEKKNEEIIKKEMFKCIEENVDTIETQLKELN